MCIVRMIAMILLAAYLIFGGFIMLLGMTVPPIGLSVLGLIGIGAGVLILISFCGKGGHDTICK